MSPGADDVSGLLRARDVWVFDLDNTLYPADSAVFHAIGDRMADYIARLVGVDRSAAEALRERYLHEYGATFVGLVERHGCDAGDFMAYVHDVPLDAVAPDPALARLIAGLPGRKYIHTNGARSYALKVMARLGIGFDAMFAIEDAGFAPKPTALAFARLCAAFGFAPAQAVFFDDSAANTRAAREAGFVSVLVSHRAAEAGAADHATPTLAAFLDRLTAAPPGLSHRG